MATAKVTKLSTRKAKRPVKALKTKRRVAKKAA
jgi:hypothetical protein